MNRIQTHRRSGSAWLVALAVLQSAAPAEAQSLPGTRPLILEGEAWDHMVAGIDRFLLGEIKRSPGRRSALWQRDTSSREAYEKSVTPNRKRLQRILGAVDQRTPFTELEFLTTSRRSSLVGRGESYDIHVVRWPVLTGVTAEGLLLVPTRRPVLADIIAIPDADQTPEVLAGLIDCDAHHQFGRRFAENGCRVLIPTIIDRRSTHSVTGAGRKTNQTHREFVYRPAFELGRHIIGYEVQKILAAVDWFSHDTKAARPIGVFGYGEGGLLSLYSAAIDPRIAVCCTSGYFDARSDVWQEPIYRNVFGLLHEFGDAEIASLIAPRVLIVEACRVPVIDNLPPVREGRRIGTSAPGRWTTPNAKRVAAEFGRALGLCRGLARLDSWRFVVSGEGDGPQASEPAVAGFLGALLPDQKLQPIGKSPARLRAMSDPDARLRRQLGELLQHTQHLLRESQHTRREFFAKADRSSLPKFQQSMRGYRTYFYEEVIGRFEIPLSAPDARTRKIYDTPAFIGHEVVLDVFPDVMAYGILLLPKGIKAGERRPVVVCQHGLEGTPQMIADPQLDHRAYHGFAARLAERGFITFSPQNPYKGHDRFRTLQRKANPLKKTLFSVIVPQHQQVTDWLKSLPMVDPKRIGFYGLSYGGKTAMRVPPLVDNYCLSICSADFNDWIWKNASLRSRYSYISTVEYEIFEFDLGSTFNYAEMAGLIAPRPFMVERGHHDGVAPDERVASEYAKVRRLYADLKIPERTEIEFFDGPHTIHGVGTFDFLHRHLDWPKQK